jgi:hypothetical protein
VHAPRCGSESCLSALRVACWLAGIDAPATPELRVRLTSDAGLLALIEGTRIGTLAELAELAEATLWADKVIAF